MSNRHKFVVNRSNWLRGGKDGKGQLAVSYLCSYSGQKCCLGFYLESMGVPVYRLRGGSDAE